MEVERVFLPVPIIEDTGAEYASQNKGVMHACCQGCT
jgi:hypothetical protein